MAQDFGAALRAEIAELEAALAADLRYRRLSELKRISAELYPTPAATSIQQKSLAETFSGRTGSGRRISPERARAMEVARMFLTNRVEPTPTRDIYEHLINLGVTISGEVPLNNLSAMLSNSEEFLSHGRSGWTLRGKDDDIPESVYRDVCEIVLADYESDQLLEIYADIRNGGGIPNDIDGRLLATTRTEIRRDLTESEKRELRTWFKEMVESSLTPSARASVEMEN